MDVTSSNFKYVVSYFWRNDQSKKLIESFEFDDKTDAMNKLISKLESNTNLVICIYTRSEIEKIIE